MATNFPTSVDNFTNPTANDSLNTPSHSLQHANANDAIEAVEDYLLNGAGKTGLVHLNTTTFSAQATVNVDNVFSSTYENYYIVLNVTSQTVTGPIGSQFRTGGVAYTSGNYFWQTYGASDWLTATWTTNVYTSQTYHQLGGYVVSTGSGTYNAVTIFNPNTARRTFGVSQTISENEYRGRAFQVAATNQFDGLSFFNPSGGTITGTIRVYGIRN